MEAIFETNNLSCYFFSFQNIHSPIKLHPSSRIKAHYFFIPIPSVSYLVTKGALKFPVARDVRLDRRRIEGGRKGRMGREIEGKKERIQKEKREGREIILKAQ